MTLTWSEPPRSPLKPDHSRDAYRHRLIPRWRCRSGVQEDDASFHHLKVVPAVCDLTSPTEMVLPLQAEAVAQAREFLRAVICPTHHSAATADAELLVSELVTNGMRHAAPPIILRVECEGDDALRVLVCDASPVMPHVNHAKPEDESGRGMFLVDYISDEWGAEPLKDGKATWFRLNN